MAATVWKKVEWGALVMALTAACSAVVYVVTASSKADEAVQRVDKVETKFEHISKMLIEIRDRTARIEQWEKDHE